MPVMDHNISSASVTRLQTRVPVTPIQASMLYTYEQRQRTYHRDQRDQRHIHEPDPFNNPGSISSRGEATRHFRTGVKSLDRDLRGTLFEAGRVIGFGGVDELHARSRHLAHNLIATRLRDSDTRSSPLTGGQDSSTIVFIVEPPTTASNETSLLQIYDLLASTALERPRDFSAIRGGQNSVIDIDKLIDRVSILPYFDLTGISQALTEILDLLRQKGDGSNKAIVLLRNLGNTLALHTQPRSQSTTQTAALLTQILRQLRQLARYSHGYEHHHEDEQRRGAHQEQDLHRDIGKRNKEVDVLVLVEIGAPEAVKLTSPRQPQRWQPQDGTTIDNEGITPIEHLNRKISDTMRLKSSFSSADGRYFRMRLKNDVDHDVNIGSRPRVSTHEVERGQEHQGQHRYDYKRVQAPEPTNHRDLTLIRLIDDMLDGLVLVHDGFGILSTPNTSASVTVSHHGMLQGDAEHQCIVEVMKDRMGCALGSWAVWAGE